MRCGAGVEPHGGASDAGRHGVRPRQLPERHKLRPMPGGPIPEPECLHWKQLHKLRWWHVLSVGGQCLHYMRCGILLRDSGSGMHPLCRGLSLRLGLHDLSDVPRCVRARHICF